MAAERHSGVEFLANALRWVSALRLALGKGHQFNGSTVPGSEGPHAPGSPDRDEARLEQSESKPRLKNSLGWTQKRPKNAIAWSRSTL